MSKRFRSQTRDSALSFFVNQLDNLDKRLYEPLTSVSWSRDIKLRSGISMDEESTSFIQSTFAAGGSLSQGSGSSTATPGIGGSMPWISPETLALQGISIDGTRVVQPLRLLGREISYTSVELNRSQKLGQSIDIQKMNAMNIVYQMNTDQISYIGSQDVGQIGLLNNPNVLTATVPAGASGFTQWNQKTADEILADVNNILETTWQNSAYAK